MMNEQVRAALDHVTSGLEALEQNEEAQVWPRKGDEVWWLGSSGDVIRFSFDNSDDYFRKALAQGNLFRTHEEALAEKHAREVAAKFAGQLGARKFTSDTINHAVVMCREKAEAVAYREYATAFAHTYFDTRAQLDAAITAVGKEEIEKAMRWWKLGVMG